MTAELAQVTGTNFEETVQRGQPPVLLELGATWCGPCLTMQPVLERATKNFAECLRIAQIDVDANKALANRLNVRSLPTFILFTDGAEMARTSGAMPYAKLVQWLGKLGIGPSSETADAAGSDGKLDDDWSAFHGDADLKQFYFARVHRLAESGQLENARFPRWSQGRGTISAAFLQKHDPASFEKATGLPISVGLAMEFASITSPEATVALFDAIRPGADLAQVAQRLILAWLGDPDHLSTAFLGDETISALRCEWAATLRRALEGEPIAPSQWMALRDRARDAGRSLTAEKALARSAALLLAALCPPPEPDRAGDWLRIFNLYGKHLAMLRPVFDLGFTSRDCALDTIKLAYFRQATGERRWLDMPHEEQEAIHAGWNTDHAEEEARLRVVQETVQRCLGPEHARIASMLVSILADTPMPADS